MDSMKNGRLCPWCLHAVDLVDLAELRAIIAATPGQHTSPMLSTFADDWPAWWCTNCHAGGLLLFDKLAGAGSAQVRR